MVSANSGVPMRRLYRQLRLRPGDLYEDCAYHPVLCLGADYRDDEVWGVSLIDGNPRSCSLRRCGVRKLTPKQAWSLKTKGPPGNVGARIPEERRWWLTADFTARPVRLVEPIAARARSGRGSASRSIR